MTKFQSAGKVFSSSEFTVGSFVRHRDWAVPAAGPCQPRVGRKVMRIVDSFDSYGRIVFVCGGGKQFEAFELIPA